MFGNVLPRSNLSRNLGLLIVAITIIAMLFFTWRTWPEPITDFGRELYVPWRLAQGKVLYRDLAHLNGPLSPYFNAMLFRLFGASLMTLVVANIAILASLVLMLHRLAARMSDELSATVACVAFVILLAIGQPGPAGNYNFITPYAHEMTHGVTMSIAMIGCLSAYARRQRAIWLVGAGALLGLVFLTKPEVFLAALIGGIVGVYLSTRDSPNRSRDRALFVAAAFAPSLVAIAALSFAMPPSQAIGSILTSWSGVFDGRIESLPFYQRVRGTDDVGESVRLIVEIGAGIAIIIGALLAAGWRKRARSSQIATVVIVVAILCLTRRVIGWENIGRPLIIIVPAILIGLLWRLRRGTENDATQARLFLQLIFTIFALVLLAKIPLRVRLYHYGFALAMPALIVSIIAGVGWLPAWLDKRGGSGCIVRGGVIGMLSVTCIAYLGYMRQQVNRKTILVGHGADAFYADARGDAVNDMLTAIDALPAGATLAVVPQGAMLNYLSRRGNPTPFVQLMPPEAIVFDEQNIAQGYLDHPPDVVMIVTNDLTEYGYRSFPQYAPDVAAQIDRGYEIVQREANASVPWTMLKRR